MKKVVLDIGGDTIKCGYAGFMQEPKIIPNCVARAKGRQGGNQIYIADQIEKHCESYNALAFRRPIQRGYLVDWEAEGEILSRVFGPENLNILGHGGFANMSLCVSEQPFTPNMLREDLTQIFFEYFGFGELCVCPGAYWNMIYYATTQPKSAIAGTRSCVVVDSGYSFSHVIPIINGKIQMSGIKRVNIGGKLLGNYLREIISFRYYNMMDETYLVNTIKDRMCFVSLDFVNEMKKTKINNDLVQSYVLPDYSKSKLGYVKEKETQLPPDAQLLTLNNERIAIPELLFNPSDIGMKQAGIAEATIQSVSQFSEVEQALLYSTILLVGGNTRFPNFKQRFTNEVRTQIPILYDLAVHTPTDPITSCWKGGAIFALSNESKQHTVSIKEYQEHGHSICRNKFTK